MKNLLLPEEKRNYAERELWKSLEESRINKLMSGFGGRTSRELSACSFGKLRRVERYKGGADGLIRSVGGSAIALWVDAKDIRVADGNLSSWPTKVGTAPVQGVISLKPNFNSTGWDDGGPCVEFDSVGEALSTGQLLTGVTCTVCSTFSINAGIALRVFWEQTEAYNGKNGFYFGSLGDAAAGKTVAPLCGGGGAGTSNYIVDGGLELSATGGHCVVATHDRALGAVRATTIMSDGVEATVINVETTGDVLGNFQPGAGSYLGSRNNQWGVSRAMNGSFREFLALDNVLLNSLQRELIDDALRYKARIL